MKKILSILLLITFCFTMVPTSVYAVEPVNTDLILSVEAVGKQDLNDLRAGDIVKVVVQTPQEAQMGGVTVNLGYDSSMFTFLPEKATTELDADVTDNKRDKVITVVYLNTRGNNITVKSHANIMTVYFTVNENVYGKSNFSIKTCDFYQYGPNGTLPAVGFTAPKAQQSIINKVIQGEHNVPVALPEKNQSVQLMVSDLDYSGNILWEPTVDKGVFEADVVYKAKMILSPNEFHKFGGDFLPLVSGATISNLVVASNGNSVTFDAMFPKTAEKYLESLEITTPPTKTTYVEGTSFNPEGMVVKAVYDDGTIDPDYKGYTVEGGEALTLGTTSVTVKAGNKTVAQNITVKAKQISSLKISGDFKKQYVIGDAADWTGMVVTAVYDNGTEAVLAKDAYKVSGFQPDQYSAAQPITVSAGGKTATFNIQVAKKTLTKKDFVLGAEKPLYDAKAHPATVTYQEGITGAGTIAVKYDGKTTVPVNAGVYQVSVDVPETETYQNVTNLVLGDFEILKATPIISVDAKKTVIIGNKVTLNATTTPADLKLTYTSKDSAAVKMESDGTVTGLKVTNKPVEVLVNYAGSENYEAVTKTVQVTVVPKHVVGVTFENAATQTYKPEGYVLGAQFKEASSVSKAGMKYIYAGKTYDSLKVLEKVTVKDAGVYTVKAIYEDAKNYGTKEATFTITKADQSPLSVMESTVQMGHDLLLSTKGGSGEGKVTYTVKNETGKATLSGNKLTPTQAGTVTVVAMKSGDKNYNSVSSAPKEITIYQPLAGKQEISLEAPEKNNIPQKTLTDEGFDGVIAWSPTVEQNKFGPSTVYTAKVTLNVKEYYTFAQSFEPVVNGATVSNLVVASNGNSVTFDATFPKTAAKVIESLEITTPPTKTIYVEGTSFNPEGMVVKVVYDDGTIDPDYKAYTVEGGEALTLGTTSVTVKAGSKKVVQNITVKAKQISSLKISGDFKKQYVIGDAADWTGMVVTAVYDNGTEAVLAKDAYEVSGFQSDRYSVAQPITVSAGGKTATFNIQVAKKTLTKKDFVLGAERPLYDTKEHPATVTYQEGITGAGKVAVKYDGKTTVPVNAGVYQVAVDVPETETYQKVSNLVLGDFEILKATPVVTVDAEKTVIIGNKVSLNATTTPADLKLTYTSKDNAAVKVEADGTVTGLKVTDKPVEVLVNYAGSENYEAVTKTVQVMVAPKHVVTVTFENAATQTYKPEGYPLGSQFKEADIALKAGTMKYIYAGKTYDSLKDLEKVTVKDAGVYTVKAVYEDAENYGTKEATFTITKADQSPLSVMESTVQMGHDLVLSTTGGSREGKVFYTVKNGTGKATLSGNKLTPTQAGTVTVVAMKAGDKNYNSVSSAPKEITVSKADSISFKGQNITKIIGSKGQTQVKSGIKMPANAGAVKYDKGALTDKDSIIADWSVNSADGTVSFGLSGKEKVGSEAVMTVVVHSVNYEDSTVPIYLKITDKMDQLPLKLTCDTHVIYGDKLDLSAVGGSLNTPITFTVENISGKADVKGNTLTALQAGTVKVVAKRAGNAEYKDAVSEPVEIVIEKATPTGKPDYVEIQSSDKTLKDANLKCGTISVPGTVKWQEPDSTVVEANKDYAWIFTPEDGINYNTLQGTIRLYEKYSGGGGGGGFIPPIPEEPSGQVTVTTPDKDMIIKSTTSTDAVLRDVKATVKNSNLVLIGDKTTSVNITATKNNQNVQGFIQPVEVAVEVAPQAIAHVKDTSKLTLAQVKHDKDGKVVFEFMGGHYDASKHIFYAKVDNAGDYVLLEKGNVTKIVLQIGSKMTLINDKKKEIDVAPSIINNRTMVPLRYIAEALGSEVIWKDSSRTITIKKGNTVLNMAVDKELPGFGAAPVIKNGRTLVPVRYVSEKLGANVIYDPALKEVTIIQ